MNTFARLIKLLLVCLFIVLRFSCAVVMLLTMNGEYWGVAVGMSIVWGMLMNVESKVKQWAEKI